MTDNEPSQIDEALGLLRIPGEHRPAYREMLERIVKKTKQLIAAGQGVTRSELRVRLEKIAKLSQELGRTLDGNGVEKAIRLSHVEREANAQAQAARKRCLDDLEAVGKASSRALKELGLKGRGPTFGSMDIKPKTLLAVYGREIFGFSFQEKGKPYPSQNSGPYCEFLSHLWTAVMGEEKTGEEKQDWTHTIRVVNRKRDPEAHNGIVLATMDAHQMSHSLKGVLKDLEK